MGEPANPTPADRAETRRFAAAIVDAVRNDESLTFGDKDQALFRLAQEIELLTIERSEFLDSFREPR